MKKILLIFCAATTIAVPLLSMAEQAPQMKNIDEIIALEKDDKRRLYLEEFKQQHKNARINAENHSDHWIITVTGNNANENYTSGSEQYKMLKINGSVQMLWHEHPREIE